MKEGLILVYSLSSLGLKNQGERSSRGNQETEKRRGIALIWLSLLPSLYSAYGDNG